jgi:hypothetical protein
MMRTSKSNRNDIARRIVGGLKKHFAKTKTIVLDGENRSPSEIIAILEDCIAAGDETAATKAAYVKAVDAERAKSTQVAAIALALKGYLRYVHGAKSTVLGDFGFVRPDTKPTVETKADAVKKRSATRKARGTMGKRQKAKVKGQPTDGAPTPPPDAGAAGAPPTPPSAEKEKEAAASTS